MTLQSDGSGHWSHLEAHLGSKPRRLPPSQIWLPRSSFFLQSLSSSVGLSLRMVFWHDLGLKIANSHTSSMVLDFQERRMKLLGQLNLLLLQEVMPDSMTPWTAAHQASLYSTVSQSLLKFMSFESMMLPNHLIICSPLLLLPSIFPSISVFSDELGLHIRWPKYWSFSFNISPSNEYSGWFPLGLTGWSCSSRDSQESFPAPEFKSISAGASLPSKLAQHLFSCILTFKAVPGPAQISGYKVRLFYFCGGVTKPHCRRVLEQAIWQLSSENTICPICCLMDGGHIPTLYLHSRLHFQILKVFRYSIYSVSTIHPPCFSSIKLDWVPTNG